MKKTYISPRLFILNAEASEMICASRYSVHGGTQWGTEGEYAPSEWINEGHDGESFSGYDVVDFGDEGDDDLPSR